MRTDIVAQLGLDPDVLHLNHGAFGTVPVAVREAQRGWQERSESNPHRFNREELPGLITQARSQAAAFLGVETAATALVRNVSEAVSAVLASLDLAEGDEVVLGNHAYGAVRKAVEHWVARRGVVLVEAAFAIDAIDDVVVTAYSSVVTARTRLVIVDQITSPTAMQLPVAAIAAAVDAPVLADAAHVPGSLRTDIAALGVTYWVGNLHKWAFTSRGTAVLWVDQSARASTWPLVLSWQIEGDLGQRFDYPGTWDYSAWLALGAGLDFWRGLGGWDMVGRCRDLAGTGQRLVADALGTPLDGLAGTWSPTMRLVRLPDGQVSDRDDVQALYERLSVKHGIEVAPVAFGGLGYLRIAAAAYNTVDDYERLATALT